MASSLDIEWLRPSTHKLPNPEEDEITFQHTDIDHYMAPKRPGLIGPNNNVVPVVRLYGATEDGTSVLCHVHGFHPYFYVYTQQKPDQSKLLEFRRMLDRKVKSKNAHEKWVNYIEEVVLEVDYVSCKSVYGYFYNEQQYFLKIVVAIPRATQLVRDLFATGGIESMGVYFEGRLSGEGHRIFEANIDYETRFMSDLNIHGCGWIRLALNKYKMRANQDHISHCQLECDVNYTDLDALPPEGRWAKIAPLRTLSFDIETTVKGNLQPRPAHESVIQISNIVTKHGHDKPFITCIFTLRSCAPIEGAVVKSYENEAEMLMDWYRFIIDVDPDIVTGWCIQIFDIHFLVERAKVLGITDFLYLGRLTKAPRMQLSEHKWGPNTVRIYNTEGRVQFDLASVIHRYRRDRPERCKLNHAAIKYLKEEKDGIEFTEITRLFNGNAQDRRRLAVYCIKDSKLVLDMVDKLKMLDFIVELSRVTGAPLVHLLDPKKQTKLNSLLLREAKKRNYLLPDVQAEPPLAQQTKDVEIPEFSTLYANVIIDNALCYTTLLSKPAINRFKLQPDEYIETPVGTFFKKPGKSHQTVLPGILENLLAAREVVMNDLSRETEALERVSIESRQRALETSVGLIMSYVNYYESGLPCYEIAISLKPIAHQSPNQKRARSEARASDDRVERSTKLIKTL